MDIISGGLILSRNGEQVRAALAMVQGRLETLASYLDRLHPEERTRYNSCKHDRRKESYLLGRLSAKAALCELTGFSDAAALFIDTGVFDFPIVKCADVPNKQVSISHCEGVSVSVAFAEAHPMGVDIEMVSDRHEDSLRKQITAKEEELLRSLHLDDIRGYTLLWSIKESLSKVIRTGMMIDFALLEINTLSSQNTGEYVSTFSQFGQYQTVSCCAGDYTISLTLPKKSKVDFCQASSLFSNLIIGPDGR